MIHISIQTHTFLFLCTDDEFEEVPEKEGYEPVIPSHLRAEYGEYSLGGHLLDEPNLLISENKL